MTIHANETCTVTYVNGVTGETIDTAEVAYAAVIPAPGTAPDVEGYEFKEWFIPEMYTNPVMSRFCTWPWAMLP